MATTTPNYGWTVPTSTDLVKDGATAIETLGDAIDASMNTALGTKKAGMVLLNTTSFSGVASQSINDVFSATYDYYKLVLNVKGSTNNGMNLRLRVSGADNSTSNYKFGQLRFDFSAGTNNQSSNGTTQFTITHTTTEFYGAQELTFYYPFKTERTTMSGTGTGLRSDYTSGTQMVIGGFFDANTSFTGFTLIGNGGTITGDVSTYGYNK
jgi:hypothetical protein